MKFMDPSNLTFALALALPHREANCGHFGRFLAFLLRAVQYSSPYSFSSVSSWLPSEQDSGSSYSGIDLHFEKVNYRLLIFQQNAFY